GVSDPRNDWLRIREIGEDGALLVRPDQIIAWRTMGAQREPGARLAAALRAVLRQGDRYGAQEDGALLVRPDQIIAWRTMGAVPAPRAQLEAALRAVLRRSREVE
nr:hypothetical protein [Burkholderiaceae bacterium]